MTKNPKVVVTIKPVRLAPKAAAEVLSIHHETLRELIARGVFTVICPRGRGVGKRIYLLTEEVEIYGTRGEEALREHRAKIKPAKRRA